MIFGIYQVRYHCVDTDTCSYCEYLAALAVIGDRGVGQMATILLVTTQTNFLSVCSSTYIFNELDQMCLLLVSSFVAHIFSLRETDSLLVCMLSKTDHTTALALFPKCYLMT